MGISCFRLVMFVVLVHGMILLQTNYHLSGKKNTLMAEAVDVHHDEDHGVEISANYHQLHSQMKLVVSRREMDPRVPPPPRVAEGDHQE